eukprot:3124843-Prymnesium_polylepis.2
MASAKPPAHKGEQTVSKACRGCVLWKVNLRRCTGHGRRLWQRRLYPWRAARRWCSDRWAGALPTASWSSAPRAGRRVSRRQRLAPHIFFRVG